MYFDFLDFSVYLVTGVAIGGAVGGLEYLHAIYKYNKEMKAIKTAHTYNGDKTIKEIEDSKAYRIKLSLQIFVFFTLLGVAIYIFKLIV